MDEAVKWKKQRLLDALEGLACKEIEVTSKF
jgi:hypothetical protein